MGHRKPTIIIQSVFVLEVSNQVIQFRVHFGVEKRHELEHLDSMPCPGKSFACLSRIDRDSRGNLGEVRKCWIGEGNIGNEADVVNTAKGDAQVQKMLGSRRKPMMVFGEQVLTPQRG
jgi:hypothetical protein